LQKRYKDFCMETGLEKDYSRLQVTKEEIKKKNTKQVDSNIKQNEYKIVKQPYYEDKNGVKYKVDNKHVKMEPSQREMEVAEILGKLYKTNVNIIPKVAEPSSIKTPDYIINNERFDLKEIEGNKKNTLDNAIRKQERQAHSFVLDISKTDMSEDKAFEQIQGIFNSKHRSWVDRIILIKKDTIIQIFER